MIELCLCVTSEIGLASMSRLPRFGGMVHECDGGLSYEGHVVSYCIYICVYIYIHTYTVEPGYNDIGLHDTSPIP
jgi:hypothetical protein